MSGGHFEYLQHKMDDSIHEMRRVARCLAGQATAEDMEGSENWGPKDLDPKDADIPDIMNRAAAVIRSARNLLHAVDYMLCGDSGADCVRKVWDNEEKSLAALLSFSEKEMRARGWVPVGEWLKGYQDDRSMSILAKIDQDAHAAVSEDLAFYASRPGFYNPGTDELMEVGNWNELKKSVG